jgi:hypothetical protein
MMPLRSKKSGFLYHDVKALLTLTRSESCRR